VPQMPMPLGYTGKGVTVGVTDLPVNFTSPELAPKTGSYDVEGVTAFNWAELSHGTHVAGIMVAAKDDTGMHGIAFDAECISRRVANEYQSNGSFDRRSDLYEPYLAASMSGVKAINNSWGRGKLGRRALKMIINMIINVQYIFRGRDFAQFCSVLWTG
jgi:subtilase-type serine protease